MTWTEQETKMISADVDAAWQRVSRLGLSQDYVLHRLPREMPELYARTEMIMCDLNHEVPFDKARSMIVNWEGTWKQIAMKAMRRKK